MKVSICGTEAAQGSVLQLERMIRVAIPEHSIGTCSRIEDLPHSLGSGAGIAVMVAADESELRQFIALREELDDVRVILVLPGDELAMVVEAQKLRPRFMAFSESNFHLVGMVLRKMVAAFAHPSLD
ncbi:MAG: hypothetical protein ABFD97_25995 [Syntrophobacter sp.]